MKFPLRGVIVAIAFTSRACALITLRLLLSTFNVPDPSQRVLDLMRVCLSMSELRMFITYLQVIHPFLDFDLPARRCVGPGDEEGIGDELILMDVP